MAQFILYKHNKTSRTVLDFSLHNNRYRIDRVSRLKSTTLDKTSYYKHRNIRMDSGRKELERQKAICRCCLVAHTGIKASESRFEKNEITKGVPPFSGVLYNHVNSLLLSRIHAGGAQWMSTTLKRLSGIHKLTNILYW